MNQSLAKRVGEAIRKTRKRKGLTQTTLGNKVGVVKTHISKWECGVVMPHLDNLDALAQAMGVSMADLLVGKEGETSRGEYDVEAVVAQLPEETRKALKDPAQRAWIVEYLGWPDGFRRAIQTLAVEARQLSNGFHHARSV